MSAPGGWLRARKSFARTPTTRRWLNCCPIWFTVECRRTNIEVSIARAIADVQQLRPALIVSVRGQLRDAQSGLGRDPGNSDLHQRVDALSKLDQALKTGWPLKELGALQGIGVTHIALDVAPVGTAIERFRVLGRAVERTIRDLPEEQRLSFLERLSPEADKR